MVQLLSPSRHQQGSPNRLRPIKSPYLPSFPAWSITAPPLTGPPVTPDDLRVTRRHLHLSSHRCGLRLFSGLTDGEEIELGVEEPKEETSLSLPVSCNSVTGVSLGCPLDIDTVIEAPTNRREPHVGADWGDPFAVSCVHIATGIAPIHWRAHAQPNGGDPDADEPAQGGGRRLPVAPRRRRPGQARAVARRARRARRCRGHAPRRGPPGPRRRALLPQHRRAGDHVPGGYPCARGGGAAEPGLHAGGVRVLPIRLRGAPPHHQRRGQRRGAGRRRQAWSRPRRRDPQGRRRPGPPRWAPGRRPRLRPRPGPFERPVGHGAVPAHLRHDEPPQGGAPDAAQPGGVRPEHPRRVPLRRDGRDGGGAPALPRARPPLRPPGLPGLGRLRGAPRRRAVLGVHLLGRHARGGGHVVHSRAHHPPDHPRSPRVPPRAAVPVAPLHPQLQRVPGAVHPGEAGGGIRLAGAGGVRDDGGVPPDDVEPSAAGRRAEAGIGGAAGGAAGDGGPGRGGQRVGRRGARRGVREGRERDGGVQEQPGGERGGVPVRMVSYGGHRRGGRGRVPAPGGADQGAHQPRRREDLPDRGGLGAARPPVHRAGRGLRRARRQVRRGDQLRGDPAGGGGARGGGGGGLLPEEPGGVQGAQEGVHRRRPAQDGHRQDPAPHRRAALLRAAGQGLETEYKMPGFLLLPIGNWEMYSMTMTNKNPCDSFDVSSPVFAFYYEPKGKGTRERDRTDK